MLKILIRKRSPLIDLTFKRWKHNNKVKRTPSIRALDHFDDFYGNLFCKNWKSIRISLLSEHKYCAVVNNYGDSEKTMADLENCGALNIRTFVELKRTNIEKIDKNSNISENLKPSNLSSRLENFMIDKSNDEINMLYKNQNSEERIKKSELNKNNNSDEFDEKNNKENIEREISRPYENLSMNKRLESAEYDETRIFDPDVNLSSAALYEYMPATKIKGMEDWIFESEHYKYYDQSNDFPVTILNTDYIHFPEHLNVYTFENGNVDRFDEPKKCSTEVLNYYLMDGSSLLPVLALDIQPGHNVLDLCASPGGKSLLMLQTLYPNQIICNDNQLSRVNRIKYMFNQYFYDVDERKSKGILQFTKCDGRLVEGDNFDRILVDVPCTTDRHSVNENDNNIFKPTRTKERLRIPELQCELLTNALKLVKIGGSVVYSTCSLSPIQNDGVVHMALKRIWQETNKKIIVRDLKNGLEPFKCLYKFETDIGMKYGHLVVPFLHCNFGPMYFCKLDRIE